MNLQPTLNTWTTLFLVVVLHGVALSIIFFARKKGKRLPNMFLGFFLFLFSLNLLSNVAYWTRYNIEFPHMLGMSATFQFLYGPLLFFYALSILKPNKKWRLWEALHFLPFLVYLVDLFPMYIQPTVEKAAILQQAMQSDFELTNKARFVVLLKSFHMTVYAGLLFNLKKLNSTLKISFRRISPEKNRWIGIIKYCFTGYILCYVLFFVLVEAVGYGVEYDYIISFGMSLFIFTIGYVGLIKPEYLYEAHNGSKYESSSLEKVKADKYIDRLLSYMEREKPFINGDLKLKDLAEELNIPRHHLSQIINERLEKNFFEFLNSYRVEEAKKILLDPQKRDYIILRVAFESGFNNKTTFNSAFKNETGTTPSEFRKQRLNGKVSHH